MDIVIERNERGQFNGNGHFVVEDIKAAREVVKMHGGEMWGRSVYFEVDGVEEFLQDPLSAEECRQLKGRKEQEVKGEHREKPAERKEENKAEKKPAESQDDWVTYKFVKTVFPKKSSFKDWLRERKFDVDSDLKQVEKIEGDESNAKVTMRRKVYTALNGTDYEGKKVVFHEM